MQLEEFAKKISDYASIAAKKAGDQVSIAKMGLDKAGLEKEVEGIQIAMGRYCYTAIKGGTKLPEELMDYYYDIDNVKKEIEKINNDISKRKMERDAVSYDLSNDIPVEKVASVKVPIEVVEPVEIPADGIDLSKKD